MLADDLVGSSVVHSVVVEASGRSLEVKKQLGCTVADSGPGMAGAVD